tara:strand:+ start:493 stop:684 length:192 start_codon:yes stop_codon:yes gene_type:complete
MKESDYINIGNRVKLITATNLLVDILVLDDDAKNEDKLRPIIKALRELDDDFYQLIKITEVDT